MGVRRWNSNLSKENKPMFISGKMDMKIVVYSYLELHIEVKKIQHGHNSERSQMQKGTYCAVFHLSKVQKQTKLTCVV